MTDMNIQVPPELRRSRPRDVQLTAAGTVMVVVGSALLVGAVVLTIVLSRLAAQQNGDRRALASDGAVTNAHVVRLWRESNEHKTPRVGYAMTIDGREFEGRAKLPLSWWQSLHTGSELNVRYLPSDPSRNEVVDAEWDVLPVWLPVPLGMGMATLGAFCLWSVQRQRRLLADGRVAPATVTKVTKHHTTHGGSYRAINFTFSVLSGAKASGRSTTTRKGADAGAAVWIVYDPEQPKRAAVYPFQFVKVTK